MKLKEKNKDKEQLEYPYMTFEEMKKEFPNEYLRIGNPQFEGIKLKEGFVILHGKDDLELAYQFRDMAHGFKTFTAVYTGEFTKISERKWLRFNRLS